jgi:glycosyltransferase involved in cell wall biosynthesis
MACGTPCVATDVGDVRQIVGPTGRCVPRRDATRLAAAGLELLSLSACDRRALGLSARRRIAERYGLDAIAQRHLDLWRQCCRPNSPHVPRVRPRG